VGLDFIILGFPAVNRFHIERMAQDKGDSFLLTQVGEPLPRQHTFHADNDILFIGSNDTKKRFRSRWQIFVHEFCPVLIENADVHRFRM
jgi:hypothetical protein